MSFPTVGGLSVIPLNEGHPGVYVSSQDEGCVSYLRMRCVSMSYQRIRVVRMTDMMPASNGQVADLS